MKKLHSGELHNLYSPPDIIRRIKSRRMRWAGHVARVEEGINLYRALVGKPEGKKELRRRRRRWEDGIKMDLGEISWGGGVDSSGSGLGPVAGCRECGDELPGSGAKELVDWCLLRQAEALNHCLFSAVVGSDNMMRRAQTHC
jgi:hypothetical protein